MARMNLNVTVHHETDSVRLTLFEDARALGWVGFTAAELDAFMRTLERARAFLGAAAPEDHASQPLRESNPEN
ncbi:hypothetical protein [Terrarubrum flagellatum]|uniref:hypothetical protein n=1 Tax=Terrirubrum flagellatum TaxID=2895980 RepID=UPI0031453D0D